MRPALKRARLSVGTVFLLVFILVSSGPYGVEEMVSASGPGMTLLLILLIPLVWGGPMALLCTELPSAIPAEGGSYVWIERGLGRFWAFQSGWWFTISGWGRLRTDRWPPSWPRASSSDGAWDERVRSGRG